MKLERSSKLSKKRRDWRQKRWGEKMKNMRQGSKKVRSVTEEKIQWDSSSQRKKQRQAACGERAQTPVMRKT